MHISVIDKELQFRQMTQFADIVRTRLISQLVKDISRVIQNLPKHFNGTTISTSTVLP